MEDRQIFAVKDGEPKWVMDSLPVLNELHEESIDLYYKKLDEESIKSFCSSMASKIEAVLNLYIDHKNCLGE